MVDGVAAATRALSDRATQLCRAMLAYEREQSRDLAKEAEARERRRAEAEEKRRQREAAEEAKRPETLDDLQQQIDAQLKTVYDPEIPVNIVDLGLVYDSTPSQIDDGWRVDVKMTLTAPGCGMGPVLQQDAQNRLLCIEGVNEADVQVVWDPPWSQDMMSEAAKLQLGMM